MYFLYNIFNIRISQKHMTENNNNEGVDANESPRLDITPQARGIRARAFRQALRYSRRALAQKYPFLKEGTLQNWEDARFGGLTENGARQLAKAYNSEGLDCREEWLFYGIGSSPFETSFAVGTTNLRLNQLAEPKVDYQTLVTKELDLFHQCYTNSVDAIIADDGLHPGLWLGDHVAGVRYYAENLDQIMHIPCIIQTQLGEVLVRILTPSGSPDRYNLACTNPNTTVSQPILEDIRIFSAAPVLWVLRKKDFFIPE